MRRRAILEPSPCWQARCRAVVPTTNGQFRIHFVWRLTILELMRVRFTKSAMGIKSASSSFDNTVYSSSETFLERERKCEVQVRLNNIRSRTLDRLRLLHRTLIASSQQNRPYCYTKQFRTYFARLRGYNVLLLIRLRMAVQTSIPRRTSDVKMYVLHHGHGSSKQHEMSHECEETTLTWIPEGPMHGTVRHLVPAFPAFVHLAYIRLTHLA